MAGHAFLTDRRRELLDGEYDSEDQADRQLKHRTKTAAETAIGELIEVAQSDTIDTREVFEPEQVATLIRHLLAPDVYVHPVDGAPDDWKEYQDDLYVQIDKTMHLYRNNRFPDPHDDS